MQCIGCDRTRTAQEDGWLTDGILAVCHGCTPFLTEEDMDELSTPLTAVED